MLTDTHAQAEAVQIALLRQAPVWRRLQLVSGLVQVTRQLSWQGLCQRHPEESLRERQVRWVELMYGAPLATKLRTRLSEIASS